nr:hypothetical protein [Sneathiella sp.]
MTWIETPDMSSHSDPTGFLLDGPNPTRVSKIVRHRYFDKNMLSRMKALNCLIRVQLSWCG